MNLHPDRDGSHRITLNAVKPRVLLILTSIFSILDTASTSISSRENTDLNTSSTSISAGENPHLNGDLSGTPVENSTYG